MEVLRTAWPQPAKTWSMRSTGPTTMGKLAMRAKRSEVGSTSSGWFDSLDQNKYGIELRRLGDFPIREKLSVDNLVSSVGNTTLIQSRLAGISLAGQDGTNSPATLSLDFVRWDLPSPCLRHGWLHLMTKTTPFIRSPVALLFGIQQAIDRTDRSGCPQSQCSFKGFGKRYLDQCRL
jgi:hypothetical protein